LQLPWHVAHKKIPHLGENGELVDPETPNGYKFETFVFDALSDAKKTTILEVARENEFSPVKNAQGMDSPETARNDLSAQFHRWLQAAGMEVGEEPNGLLEISPLFALDLEELKKKYAKGLVDRATGYLR